MAGGAPVLLVGIVVLISGCGLFQKDVPQEEDVDHQRRAIEEVQATHTPEWMEISGVVGTGIGLCDDEPCIRVFLSRPSAEAQEAIPEEIEGYRVELIVTGEFRTREP